MLSKAEKCRFMLQRLGLEFVRVTPATGHWRTSHYADCYRWEWSGLINGRLHSGGCYETMTECVKARQLQFTSDRKDEVMPAKQAGVQ